MQGPVSKLFDSSNLSPKKIPDAVLAVGQPTVAIAEENTLSVFGLALKIKHLVNILITWVRFLITWVKWVKAAHPGVA